MLYIKVMQYFPTSWHQLFQFILANINFSFLCFDCKLTFWYNFFILLSLKCLVTIRLTSRVHVLKHDFDCICFELKLFYVTNRSSLIWTMQFYVCLVCFFTIIVFNLLIWHLFIFIVVCIHFPISSFFLVLRFNSSSTWHSL